MTRRVLLDSDVLIKIAAYDLVQDASELMNALGREVATLRLAAIIVPKQIRKSRRIADKESAELRVRALFDVAHALEPSPEEVLLAADLEGAAADNNVSLDSGESLLMAMVICASADLLITGDKRAIGAIEVVMADAANPSWKGRVGCLEQLVLAMLRRCDGPTLMRRICREAACDLALGICFSCATMRFDPTNVEAGLRSYIRSMRLAAPFALVQSDDLT